MTLPLTRKQEKLWRYIASCERSPSYTEMMVVMGTQSKSSIHRLAHTLKSRGFATFIPGSARSIVALDPTTNARASFISTDELTAELGRRGFGVVMLPLHGRIS